MPGTAEQPHAMHVTPATATRNFMTRYLQALRAPKTPEHLRHFIADEELMTHIAQAEAAFPGYTIDVEDLVIEDTRAVLRGRLRGVHRGDFHGVPASGRTVNVAIFVMYDVRDDRVASHSMVLDTLGLMQQIHALPENA